MPSLHGTNVRGSNVLISGCSMHPCLLHSALHAAREILDARVTGSIGTGGGGGYSAPTQSHPSAQTYTRTLARLSLEWPMMPSMWNLLSFTVTAKASLVT
jgi:hypothetical protein